MTPLNNAAAQPGDDEAGDAADAMPAISAAATVTVSVTITDAVEQHDIGEALVDIADALASALENSASADAAGELFAAALAELADRRGSGTLRHAAHVLRGRKGGRPRLDVERAVDEAVDLHKSGRVKTLNKGFLKVARTMPGTAALRSKAELLRNRHHDRRIVPGYAFHG